MNTLDQYQQYLLEMDKSAMTIKGYVTDLKQFQKWLGSERSLETISSTDVRGYRDYLMSKAASPNTISRHLASLASFGQWGADKAKLFSENPALHIEPIEVATLAPRWLDKVQKRRLLTTIENDLRTAREKYPRLWLIRYRDSIIVNLLLMTGLRVGELCDLRISDLALGERKGSLLVRNGKGRKQRTVVLMNETRKQLAEWLTVRPPAASDRVFIGQRGEPVRPRIVQRVVARYAKKAEVEDVAPHTLRHTFSKSLLDSGASLVEVSKLLGHKSLDSTARYTQPSDTELQDAVERMGELT